METEDETTSPGLPVPPLWATELSDDMQTLIGTVGELREAVRKLTLRAGEVRSLERRVRKLERLNKPKAVR